MPRNPLDPLRSGAPTPTGLPVRNQGGLASPAPPQKPLVPPAPAVRARKDSVIRPVRPEALQGGAVPAQQRLQAPPLPPPPVPALQGVPGAVTPPVGVQPPQGAAMAAAAPATAPAAPQTGPVETVTKSVTPEGEVTTKAVTQPQLTQPPAEATRDRTVGETLGRTGITPGTPQARRATEIVHKQLQEYGDYPGKDDPNFPAPPINPAGRNFNPFTGKFTSNPIQKGLTVQQMLGLPSDDQYIQEYMARQGGQR